MNRKILASPVFWLAAAGSSIALAFGCSSSSSSGSSGSSGSGGDAATSGDTGNTGDGGDGGDGGVGVEDGHVADGPHDGAAPDALYGACAALGSFGASCTAAATGPDPTECTDPNFSVCFVGGQGAWCTKACTGLPDCTNGASDAGCIATGCNARGYCK